MTHLALLVSAPKYKELWRKQVPQIRSRCCTRYCAGRHESRAPLTESWMATGNGGITCQSSSTSRSIKMRTY